MKTIWHSSYEANSYGDLFYSLIRTYQPDKVVELGTRTGYSAYHIARGLKDFSLKHQEIEYLTLEPFPSLTFIRKK